MRGIHDETRQVPSQATMQRLDHFLAIRPWRPLQINLALVRPGVHQVIAAKQHDAWQGRNLLKRLLIRFNVAARLEKSAELRINKD